MSQQNLAQPVSKNEAQLQVDEHVKKMFNVLEFKGKGAYGVVWKVQDKKTLQIYALKKVFDAFHNSTDAQRTFREVIFLEQLTAHDNIIKLLQIIKAENDKDLYLVFEYMESDLHKVVRAGILDPIHVKYITYQIIKALLYLHSGGLVHRDLKPSNLLVDSKCKIKLADFGLARSLVRTDGDDEVILTEYVATRWYRAPEILMGSQKYSEAVDIWSLGCIVGEMYQGKSIFPGNSTLNQIELIVDLLGKPTNEELDQMYSPLAINIIKNIPSQKKKQFNSGFSLAPPDAIDFIRLCLQYDPNRRITIEEAFKHPFLQEFSGSEDESTMKSILLTPLNDNHKFSAKDYRNALYFHIQKPNIENKFKTSPSSKQFSSPKGYNTNQTTIRDKSNLESSIAVQFYRPPAIDEQFISQEIMKTTKKRWSQNNITNKPPERQYSNKGEKPLAKLLNQQSESSLMKSNTNIQQSLIGKPSALGLSQSPDFYKEGKIKFLEYKKRIGKVIPKISESINIENNYKENKALFQVRKLNSQSPTAQIQTIQQSQKKDNSFQQTNSNVPRGHTKSKSHFIVTSEYSNLRAIGTYEQLIQSRINKRS